MKIDIKEAFKPGNGRLTKMLIRLVLLVGVVIVVLRAADWGTSHQIIGQSVIKQGLELQKPWRIEDVVPEVIISPLVDKLVDMNEFSPIEQKIIEKWGYRDGILAIAIFSCESGLDQYAVSATGDLGIAQINWRAHRAKVEAMGRTSADLLNDVDFNLEVAYIIWEASGWEAWSVYNSGVYLSCLQ